jgi:hypothetical protein
MGKRYFKGPQEPDGSDLEYIEFTDGWPSRQVDIVDGQYYSSLDEPVPGIGGSLADQSLGACGPFLPVIPLAPWIRSGCHERQSRA